MKTIGKFICMMFLFVISFTMTISISAMELVQEEDYNAFVESLGMRTLNIMGELSDSEITTSDGSMILTEERIDIDYSEQLGLIYEWAQQCGIIEEISPPDNLYNSHSYAWYQASNYEEYWITSPAPFIGDEHCNELDYDTAAVGDIIVYCSGSEYLHSAIIYDIEYVNGNKVFICESKWKSFGVYIHEWDKLPSDYYDDANNDGKPDVLFYRYTQGEHFWSWNAVSDTLHEWKCNVCSTTTNARANHNFTHISINDNEHLVFCYDCAYSFYEDHDFYMYQDNGEDGCIVKCYDCTYEINCPEAPEYDPSGQSGHYVSCPSGEFTFFEEHTDGEKINFDSYYHKVTCTICSGTYTQPHTWVTYGTKYRCLDCGRISDRVPSILQQVPPVDETTEVEIPIVEGEETVASLPPVNDEEEYTE